MRYAQLVVGPAGSGKVRKIDGFVSAPTAGSPKIQPAYINILRDRTFRLRIRLVIHPSRIILPRSNLAQ